MSLHVHERIRIRTEENFKRNFAARIFSLFLNRKSNQIDISNKPKKKFKSI